MSWSNAAKRAVYTLWAPFYDLLAGPIFAARRRRSIALLNLRPGERVLIVGAGTGLDLPHLPKDVRVTATDLTPAMLGGLRKLAGRLGLNVDAKVMDGQALDLPDGGFDAVILHLIIAVIPDPGRCLKEAQRVLKPGGRIVILDKFMPDGKRPPAVLRLINPLFSLLGTELTRQLGPILSQTTLRVVSNDALDAMGVFRNILLVDGRTSAQTMHDSR